MGSFAHRFWMQLAFRWISLSFQQRRQAALIDSKSAREGENDTESFVIGNVVKVIEAGLLHESEQKNPKS